MSTRGVLLTQDTSAAAGLVWVNGTVTFGLSAGETAHMTRAPWAGIRSGRVPLPAQARVALRDFSEGLRLAMAGGPGKVTIRPVGPE